MRPRLSRRLSKIVSSVPRQDRGKQTDAVLAKVPGEVAGHNPEVRTHHKAEVWTLRLGAHYSLEPVDRDFSIVAPEDRLVSRPRQRCTRLAFTQQETRRSVARPGNREHYISVAKHQIVGDKSAA